LLLIEIDREKFEANRRLRCRLERHPASVRVLPRTGTHHAIAIGDHPVIADGLAHGAAQLRLQLF